MLTMSEERGVGRLGTAEGTRVSEKNYSDIVDIYTDHNFSNSRSRA